MKKDEGNLIGNPPATISGVLLWDSQVHFIKIRLPVLILDVYSWVAAEAVKHEDLAEICGNVRESRQYARQAAILRKWLKNPLRPMFEFPAISGRQIWRRHLTIRPDNLPEYIAMVLAVAETPGKYARAEFMFAAQLPTPEIWCVPLFREIAAHTGPHFLGRVARSEKEMQTIVGAMCQKVKREGQDFRLRDGAEPPIE